MPTRMGAAIADLWAAIDDYDPADFRARVEALAAELPQGDGIGAFERACANDSTGRPEPAAPLYREALATGLTGIRRRRAVIQLASTLRNLGHPDESVALLRAEREEASDELDDAVVAVLALALADSGREREAAGSRSARWRATCRATTARWRTTRRSSAADDALELVGARRQRADELADLGEPGAQCRVPDLDRHHRVLDLRQQVLGLADRLRRGVEEALRALRDAPGRRRLELPPRQPEALGEAGVGALGAPVGDLDGPEQLLLELVGGPLVEQLVGGAERRERDAELVDRVGDVVEELDPRLFGRVGHQARVGRTRARGAPRAAGARAA